MIDLTTKLNIEEMKHRVSGYLLFLTTDYIQIKFIQVNPNRMMDKKISLKLLFAKSLMTPQDVYDGHIEMFTKEWTEVNDGHN